MAKKTVAKTKTSARKPKITKEAVILTPSSPRRSVPWMFLAGIVLALGLAAYYLKGYVIAAMVNGQPISRLSVIREMEKVDGGQVLDGIITQTLIAQAAKKAGTTVDEAAVDAEMQNIETQVKAQNQDLDQLLTMQSMTRD